jgi:hypothetical protein
MHMHDWNTYRNQLSAAVTGFGKLSPETVKGYAALGVAVSINAGAALVYSMRTLDAFEAGGEEQASA